MSVSRRSFMKSAVLAGGGLCLAGNELDAGVASAGGGATLPRLMGNRFITFNTVVRVNQIEVSRDRNDGEDEGALHTLQAVRAMREAFQKGFPGGRMTWAFSWLALHDQSANYQDIRRQVSEYHHELGDEVTFIPGGYFAPMYNPRRQVNRDLHDALAMVSEMVAAGIVRAAWWAGSWRRRTCVTSRRRSTSTSPRATSGASMRLTTAMARGRCAIRISEPGAFPQAGPGQGRFHRLREPGWLDDGFPGRPAARL